MPSSQAKIWGVVNQVWGKEPTLASWVLEHDFYFLLCLTTVDSNGLTVIWISGSKSGLPCGPDV